MELTPHYAYHMLRDGEKFSRDDYAFTWQDRLNMDHKDYLGAEAHQHDGAAPVAVTPTVPLSLIMEDGGYLPAGTTVRYRYTWVDQYGAETGAAAESVISTPLPVSTPDRPQVSTTNVGGSLLPGNYFYVLSAYVDDINHETNYGGRGYVTILSGNTNLITLTFPTLPSGADGWNVYRRSPGSTRYLFLDTVDMSVATPPTGYVDNGSQAPDSNKIAPAFNNTGQSKKITVTLPGATPSAPNGFTWKLYRTYASDDWDHSLVHWVVETESESDPDIRPYYEDLGNATLAGTFPVTSQIIGSPSKIDLTNAGQVTGTLPPGTVRFPHEAVFVFEGPVYTDVGSFRWRMPYEQGEILRASATLGIGSSPASVPVQVDVRVYHAATWSSVSTTLLEIAVGEEFGVLEYLADDNIPLDEGDYIAIDIIQAGGGATPTDENLTVQVIMWAKEGSATQSLSF